MRLFANDEVSITLVVAAAIAPSETHTCRIRTFAMPQVVGDRDTVPTFRLACPCPCGRVDADVDVIGYELQAHSSSPCEVARSLLETHRGRAARPAASRTRRRPDWRAGASSRVAHVHRNTGDRATGGSPVTGDASMAARRRRAGASDRVKSSAMESSGTPIAAWISATTRPVRSFPAVQCTSTGPLSMWSATTSMALTSCDWLHRDQVDVHVGQIDRVDQARRLVVVDHLVDEFDVMCHVVVGEAERDLDEALLAEIDHAGQAEGGHGGTSGLASDARVRRRDTTHRVASSAIPGLPSTGVAKVETSLDREQGRSSR